MKDVIIVGGGPAGIFAAYELNKLDGDLDILLLEKGRDIYSRNCPIMKGKLTKCPSGVSRQGCLPACSVTSGFGGAGAYSDGKFNITSEYGGWLTDYMESSELLALIEYVDRINLENGAPAELTDPSTESVRLIEQRVYGAGLNMLRSRVRHLGTDNNIRLLKSLYEYLRDRIDMRFETDVADILTAKTGETHEISGVVTKLGEEIACKRLIAVPGREGSLWLSDIFRKRGLAMTNNQVDVGVRVETSDIIMQDINKYLYEGKFVYASSVGPQVRTFCSNPSGHVVIENYNGIMTVNGHSFNDVALGSSNTNFALLASLKFTEPFNKPNEYARGICERANDLSGGSVIVQKFSDIVKGRRSTRSRIKEGFIEPTLKEAVPGDLGLILPYITMQSILEAIYALDKVTPGLASEHTLLYGVEAKFYSARPVLKNSLESEIGGMYCGGDGAGVTRGLAQASAAGVYIARRIVESLIE